MFHVFSSGQMSNLSTIFEAQYVLCGLGNFYFDAPEINTKIKIGYHFFFSKRNRKSPLLFSYGDVL